MPVGSPAPGITFRPLTHVFLMFIYISCYDTYFRNGYEDFV